MIIKCKMCGGDLNVTEGLSVAECEYCGSRQTIPSADNEKKMTLFNRAGRLLRGCEFDKAAGVYESIVADFPEEAEAYWGLVLCKYGIEYVDDPATGKKVPTCHRSSFESVLDDANFEQACEYNDAVARRLYRDEARQIEELRKRIIEVSGKEEPYDVFISYKETDDKGERTLDSVLAQDIYKELTSSGYRVFFSRISLEDKLGVEYEPYIFAALNSAKVMLVVGTDYENFDAVWVKNEWSRFLKLIEAGQKKVLIPVFKNMDAYDMPKEFNKLAAQDMGKVGAMQDLLRGIEKIIPKAKPVTAVQEKVVVGGSGDNKIASLLDRGNMALEDGDWTKADSFFEDVLNNDSKNAQAYLGKTLAQERCRTIDTFVRKRKEASQSVKAQTSSLEPNSAHVDEAVKKYILPGFVDGDAIRELYDFDLSYSSQVAGRREQYKAEEAYWANHKQLSRAEKFALGAIAENLSREKKAIFSALNERVKQAEAAENAAIKDVQKRYEAHLKQADEKAAQLFEDGLKRRENCYQELFQTAKSSADVAELTQTANKFEELGDYQDSKNLAEHCRKRAVEEQAKLDAEAERQRIQREKQEKVRKAKNKRIAIISAIAAVIVIAVIVVVTQVIVPGNKYKAAEALLAAGQYEQAESAFIALGDYKDSANRMIEAKNLKQAEIDAAIAAEQSAAYDKAQALLDTGDYSGAIAAFAALNNYRDSASKVQYAQSAAIYQEAENLLAAGKDKEAAMLFGKITDFEDAFERSLALRDPRLRNTLCVSHSAIIGLKNDGTVVTASSSNSAGYLSELSGWTDLIDLQRGGSGVAGLRSDGTVCAVGEYVSANEWTDIVQLVVGYNSLLGLKADGTVVCAGEDNYSLSKFTDIVELHICGNDLYGIKPDGSTVSTNSKGGIAEDNIAWGNLDIWKADSAGKWVGLKKDGTLTTEEVSISGQKVSVKDWNRLVDFLTDHDFIIGVKENGSLLVSGELKCDISSWNNVVRLYWMDNYTTDNLIALCSDGTVRKATENPSFMDFDISALRDIRVPNVEIQN